MKKEDAVIIRSYAGSDAAENFEASYSDSSESRTAYRYYAISDEKDKVRLTRRLERNHLYYLMAEVVDGGRITEAFLGCGQFIVRGSKCGFRLFINTRTDYNSSVRDITELVSHEQDSDITVVRSSVISEKISFLTDVASSGRIKEICFA